MFAWIEGRAEVRGHQVLWLQPTGTGLCFEMFATPSLIGAACCRDEAPRRAYLWEHRTENLRRLYACSSEDERLLFVSLLECDGVGPKSALAICGLGKPEHVWQAIRLGNTAFLKRAKGIGEKAASSVVLKLGTRCQGMGKGTGNETSACDSPERQQRKAAHGGGDQAGQGGGDGDLVGGERLW